MLASTRRISSGFDCFRRFVDMSGEFRKKEQQRVALGPGNAHYMSIRHVSLRAALAGSVLWPAAAAVPAAVTALPL